MNNTPEMYFLCCYQRKALPKVKPHLVAETALSAGAGTITFVNTFLQNMLQQIEVLLHGCKLRMSRFRIYRAWQLLGTCELKDEFYFRLPHAGIQI